MRRALTDAELIRASLAERELFGVVFDRHFAAIHSYLERRLGRDAADDRAAEVFRIAYEHRARFDAAYNDARPWLFGIATNIILKQRRRERRHLRALERLRYVGPTEPDTYEQVDNRLAAEDQHRRLMGALWHLEDRDRDVITLVAWEGLAYQEVAVALDIPIGTVRSRLNRARRQLRELLELDGNEGPTIEGELADGGVR